jgi:hypothetical protein
MKKVYQRFEIGSKEESGSFSLTGAEVVKYQEGGLFGMKLSQKMYCEGMREATQGELDVQEWTMDLTQKDRVLEKQELTIYKGQVGALQWACVGTRADAVFRTASLAGRQATPKVSDILEANEIIRELKKEPMDIVFAPLVSKKLAFYLFTDAGHKHLPGGHSMGAWSIWLSADPGEADTEYAWQPAHCLGYAGRRCRRVCKSPMGAELLAMTEGYDKVTPIVDFMRVSFDSRDVPLYLLTDSESIVTMTSKGSSPEEKRLSSDATIIQEAVSEGLKLRWIETMDMISDSMTKLMSNKTLRKALDTGKLMIPIKFLRHAHKGLNEIESKLSIKARK